MIGEEGCHRLVRALVHEELTRLSPALARRMPVRGWTEETSVDEEGLGFDSLARLDLVGELNRRLSLHLSGVEDYMLVERGIGTWGRLLAHHFKMVGEALPITFMTSGSTGAPKPVVHPLGALVREVDALAASAIARPERIVSLVPPQHIYGFLFTVLLPARLGIPVLDLQGRAPSVLQHEVRPGDLVVGTPTLLAAALPAALLPEGLHVLTSTAPAPASLWELARLTGVERMVEIYGSSETSGIGTRAAQGAPFTLMDHLEPGPDDTVLSQGAPLPLQDTLVWGGARSFTVTGRRDGMVQVGGINVDPVAVGRILSEHPGVADVHVRPGSERLKAFVVPAAGDAEALEIDLRRLMAERMPPAARPRSYRFGAALPRTPLGKPGDWPEPGLS